MKFFELFPSKFVAYCAWIVAFISMSTSLFFSEVWHLPPCLLCWYQRILMYPLVVIIGVGILTKDLKKIPYYVLPLSLIGIVVGTYHNLLYYGIIPEALAPCKAGISCTTKFFEWFGFITIPFLSLSGFILVTIAMIYLILKDKNPRDMPNPSKKSPVKNTNK